MAPLDDNGVPAQTPPHLTGIAGARAAWSFLRAEAGWSDIVPRACGDVSLLKVGPLKFHILASPDAFQHVLVDQLKSYPKSKLLDELKLVTGDGLLTSMGDYATAETTLARALAIMESARGEFHRDLLPMLGEYARLYRATGRAAEAEAMEGRATTIRDTAARQE